MYPDARHPGTMSGRLNEQLQQAMTPVAGGTESRGGEGHSPTSPIVHALYRQRELTQLLMQRMHELHDRLGGIMRPGVPQAANNAIQNENCEPTSQLLQVLVQEHANVLELIGVCEDILNRLEV